MYGERFIVTTKEARRWQAGRACQVAGVTAARGTRTLAEGRGTSPD